MSAEKTYEMLWDCPHCDAKQNLGLTHRHCPVCGAVQDAKRRYFPADDDKIAVEDHQFVGADVQCPYCDAHSSRSAKHCGNCGGAIEEGTAASRRADQVSDKPFAGDSVEQAERELHGVASVPEPKPKSRRGLKIFLAVVAVIAVLIAVFVFWKRTSALEVQAHSWARSIQIERYGPVEESSWCDEKPSSAKNVREKSEVRSKKKIADGEDCKMRRIDNGDGTFKEKQECTTKYREEPVYDDKCYFTVDRWSEARKEEAKGTSKNDEPTWPSVVLAKTGTCIGCERQGAKKESYTVTFKNPKDGDTDTCDFDQSRWASMEVGSKWVGELAVVTGNLDCDSLKKK